MDEERGPGDVRPPGDALEALHSMSGMTLVVFPAEGVRAMLPAGRRVADLSGDELTELRHGAAPLTVTEGLIDYDGAPWLVQQTGPAWAEPEEASADLCGLLFMRLDGSGRRHATEGRASGPLPAADELRRILEDVLSGEA
jgi:hypothetical protein